MAVTRCAAYRSLHPSWTALWIGILAQVGYPLTGGDARDVLSVLSVAALCLAVVLDCGRWRGLRATAAAIGMPAVLSFGIELLGARTGVPFGSYRYTGGLGPELLGVPVVVPLSWTTMSYVALAVGRRLGGGRSWGRWVGLGAAAWTLVAWDVFLDPQMVAAGHWVWSRPSPGFAGVPLSNVGGWLLTALVLVAVLDRLLPRVSTPHGIPATIVGWILFSEVLGNLLFFGRPLLAVVGGVLLGVVVAPYLHRVVGRVRA